MGPDHLSRLESGETGGSLDDDLLDVKLFRIKVVPEKFKKIEAFLIMGRALAEYAIAQRR